MEIRRPSELKEKCEWFFCLQINNMLYLVLKFVLGYCGASTPQKELKCEIYGFCFMFPFQCMGFFLHISHFCKGRVRVVLGFLYCTYLKAYIQGPAQ